MGSNLSFLQPIHRELNNVEKELHRQLSSADSLSAKVGEYIFRSGGKRLRPALLLLSAKHFGYNGAATIKIAAAVELLHTASLLHDDVLDNARLRRGAKSVNSVWGNKISILIGDFLFAKSSAILSSYSQHNNVIQLFSRTMVKMVEGELLQIRKSRKIAITEKDYIEIVDKKTAHLTSIACKIGAILAGAKENNINAMARFGRKLGIAFQITDDTLDYTSTENEFGKAIGKDIEEGKITLPLIYVLRNCNATEKKPIHDALLGVNGESNIKYIYKLIMKYRSIEYAKGIAKKISEDASSELQNLKSSRARDSLVKLAEYIIERRY
ncbi:MAG TPA: polyprenyl synthetase family protein [bacterium]